MIQVLVQGHSLGQETQAWLKKLDDNVKVFFAPIHVKRFDTAVQEVMAYLQALIACDGLRPGGCRTLYVPGGSSVVSLITASTWTGLTGDNLEILNLIKRGDGRYIPSPEMPTISLGGIEQALRAQRVVVNQATRVINLNQIPDQELWLHGDSKAFNSLTKGIREAEMGLATELDLDSL